MKTPLGNPLHVELQFEGLEVPGSLPRVRLVACRAVRPGSLRHLQTDIAKLLPQTLRDLVRLCVLVAQKVQALHRLLAVRHTFEIRQAPVAPSMSVGRPLIAGAEELRVLGITAWNLVLLRHLRHASWAPLALRPKRRHVTAIGRTRCRRLRKQVSIRATPAKRIGLTRLRVVVWRLMAAYLTALRSTQIRNLPRRRGQRTPSHQSLFRGIGNLRVDRNPSLFRCLWLLSFGHLHFGHLHFWDCRATRNHYRLHKHGV